MASGLSVDDFNLKNVDERLTRAIVLDCCEHTARQISEIKEFISDPEILARVEATTLQLFDEAFVRLETRDRKRFFRASSNGLRWRDAEMNTLFSQEEIAGRSGKTPEFAIQSSERQSLVQRAEDIWADVIVRRGEESISQSGLHGSGQDVPSPNEFKRAESIQDIAHHFPNAALESAAHLFAVKKYILKFVMSWEFKNADSEYLLVRRNQPESKIDVVFMRAKRHGKTPFSKAGLALMSDPIWDQIHPTAPLWVGLVGTRDVSCDVLDAIFTSIDAIASPGARRGLQTLWSKIYPPTAIEPLIWPANQSSKSTKNTMGAKTILPIVRYVRVNKRFAKLEDSKGKSVSVSWKAVQFLLAYVDGRTGRPLPALTAKKVLMRAKTASENPSAYVRNFFDSIRNQIMNSLSQQPFGNESSFFEKNCRKLFKKKPDGKRELTFVLRAKSSDAPRRSKL